MESETGAKISIQGKGQRQGEDEPLHAYVTSTNPEAVKKAVDKIRNIIKEAVDQAGPPKNRYTSVFVKHYIH